MPSKKGPDKGRGNAKGRGSYSSWNDGGWDDWSGYDDYYSYGSSGKGKGQWNRGTRSAWQKGSGKGESRDQFLDRLMWEDNSSRAWTEKEELAEIVACRVCTDLGIDDEGLSVDKHFFVRCLKSIKNVRHDRTMKVVWKTQARTMTLCPSRVK